MPAFVDRYFPIPSQWKLLRDTHQVLEAFKGNDLQKWLGELQPDLQMLVAQIVRDILHIMQHTGIDRAGENFVIACVQKQNPFQCFKIPCENESYWARILADTPDCATFAYITLECLESDKFQCCNNFTTSWHNRSVLLETAVCRHIIGEEELSSSMGPWVLNHDDTYFIGSQFRARVEKASKTDKPLLHVSYSMIPVKILLRMKMKKISKLRQQLREKQSIDTPAERVTIVTDRRGRAFSAL